MKPKPPCWRSRSLVKALAALSGLLMLVSGCRVLPSNLPTKQELDAASYGNPVSQSECAALVRAFFAQRLRNPESTVYIFGRAEPGYARDSLLGGEWYFGTRLLVTMNTKDELGIYKGDEGYVFIILPGRIVAAFKVSGTDHRTIQPTPWLRQIPSA